MYGDSFMAATNVSGLAYSLVSLTFECPCMPTTILYFSACAAMRGVTDTVADVVIASTPSARAISKPRAISSSVKSSRML